MAVQKPYSSSRGLKILLYGAGLMICMALFVLFFAWGYPLRVGATGFGALLFLSSIAMFGLGVVSGRRMVREVELLRKQRKDFPNRSKTSLKEIDPAIVVIAIFLALFGLGLIWAIFFSSGPFHQGNSFDNFYRNYPLCCPEVTRYIPFPAVVVICAVVALAGAWYYRKCKKKWQKTVVGVVTLIVALGIFFGLAPYIK